MNFTIDYLSNHRGMIGEISRLFFNEWSHLVPDKTAQDFLHFVSLRINTGKIPLALVALDMSGNLLGTVSLAEFDLESRKDISPWMVSLYVLEEHRNKGIATALVTRILEIAKELGYGEIYLYTEKAKGLYEGLGWELLTQDETHGVKISIMNYRI